MRESREIIVGAVTLAVVALVVIGNALHKRGAANTTTGTRLEAVFTRAEGLAVGAEVRIAGVPVGRVVGQTLDAGFSARVLMRLDPGVAVPEDSAAVIETDGLLGAKHVEIRPGGAEDMLADGDRLEYAQGSMMIEELLERIIAMARVNRAKAAEERAACERLRAMPPPPPAPAPAPACPSPGDAPPAEAPSAGEPSAEEPSVEEPEAPPPVDAPPRDTRLGEPPGLAVADGTSPGR